jgi:hypothetical protein
LKRAFALALTIMLFAPVLGFSQTRRRRPPQRRTAAASAEAAESERGDAARRVALQVKNLSQFLYLLGGVGRGIEAAEQAIKNQEASPQVIEQTAKSKASIRTAIADVRAGLENLEGDFGNTPSLRPYYQYVLGMSATAATAEKQAEAGRYDQAGRSLLKVVSQLTDALLAMRERP